MNVIEFLDDTGQNIVSRLPKSGQLEIIWGSQLTVRETQEAIFYRDGQSIDTFGPGRYILETQNIPKITKWVTKFGYGEESPFRAEVLFVSKQLFSNIKWGTREPILYRDKDLDIVRLKSFGTLSIQVNNPLKFISKLVGTHSNYTLTELQDYLKSIVVSKLNGLIGKELDSIYDLALKIDDLNLKARNSLSETFDDLGLYLHDFLINAITVPGEVQKMMDSRTGINAFGSLDEYFKFKMANAIGDSANNSGGGNDAFSTGAGLALGMMIPQYMNQSMKIDTNVQDDIVDKMKKINELKELGLISEKEFDQKKSMLLNEL